MNLLNFSMKNPEVDLVAEFEARYTREQRNIDAICKQMAVEFGLDCVELTDYIYTHRYEGD
jgi:hypothetical protein